MGEFVSKPPLKHRDKHWRKHAKGKTWVIDEQHIEYSGGKDAFNVPVGPGDDQAAGVVHVTGRLGCDGVPFSLDYYIVVNGNKEPLSPAVRRHAADGDPSGPWWPHMDMVHHVQGAGLRYSAYVAGKLEDVYDIYPQVFESVTTPKAAAKWGRERAKFLAG